MEVLYDFSKFAAQVPIEYLFDLIPVIQPRAFSIASSFKVNPQQLQVPGAVVEYKTKLSELRQGLRSKWLSRLTPSRKVPLWIRKGTLRFPSYPVTIIYYLLVQFNTEVIRYRFRVLWDYFGFFEIRTRFFIIDIKRHIWDYQRFFFWRSL